MKLFLLTIAAALGLLLGPLSAGTSASAYYSFQQNYQSSGG